MKKVMLTALAFLLLLTMTGCRRRITADAANTVCETVFQPTPVPMEGEGQQVPDTAEQSSDDTKTEIDPGGDHVDETMGAEGGETVENAEDAQAGEKLTVTLDAMGGECSTDSVIVRAGGELGSRAAREDGHLDGVANFAFSIREGLGEFGDRGERHTRGADGLLGSDV